MSAADRGALLRRRTLVAAGGGVLLAGCAGVPLSTMARLRRVGPDDLLAADARDFAVALEVDAKVKPASGRGPVVDLSLDPVEAGAFPQVAYVLACDPALPLPREFGLREAKPGRHWLAYRLTDAAARDVASAQQVIREVRAAKQRGRMSLSVRLDWIADVYPQVRGTEASTWVRLRRADGFVELWAGRVPARA
jgi:hypothetical protein